MEYRQLGPDDAIAFRQLRLIGLASDPDFFPVTLEEEENQPLDFFLSRITSNCAFGAFSSDTMVGMALLTTDTRKKRRHVGEVKGVLVSPAFRGKEIATDLMTIVEKHARMLLIECLELNVIDVNERAVRLYERLGYKKFGVRPKAFKQGSVYLDGIYMVKILD